MNMKVIDDYKARQIDLSENWDELENIRKYPNTLKIH